MTQTCIPAKSTAYLCHKSETKQGHENRLCAGSTGDQNPNLQCTALKKAGCKRIFTDKATGAHVQRPELTKCLKALNEGDTLTVWKLDRLGCSLRDLTNLLDDLQAQGVAFRSLTEAIDTTTPTGRAMWQMVGIFGGTGRLADSGAHHGGRTGRCGASAMSSILMDDRLQYSCVFRG